MERWMEVVSLLLFSSLLRPSCGSEHDHCKNYRLQFERVFSVPGDVAMLQSTLLIPSVFNQSAEPYNVTWYWPGSHQPIGNQSGRVLVIGDTLWLLNVTQADAGRFETVVRTPQRCFRQETELVVDRPPSRCGRPQTSGQRLVRGVNDRLSCPLKDYTARLHSYGLPYSVTWYKDCEQVSDDTPRLQQSGTKLMVTGVEPADQGLYTCTLHFSLAGVRGRVSETIDAEVKGDYCMLPQIHEPAQDVIRAELGSNVTKRCLVFVPCEGDPLPDVDVYWDHVSEDPRDRVYSTQQRLEKQEGGLLMDSWLVIAELTEDDLNVNYTCRVLSSRGRMHSYFTVLRKEPELLVPVCLLLGSCLLLFLLSVFVYRVFKLDLVLWFRHTFSTFYSSSDADGRLYDAYVAFPQSCSSGWTHEVERFSLNTLPKVLEELCGYSLFIPERDGPPGQALTDAVEENLKSSRRMILLYTASSFSNKHCSNNNTLLSRPMAPTNADHQLDTCKDKLGTCEDQRNSSKDQQNSSKGHLNSCMAHLSNKDQWNGSKIQLNTCKKQLYSSSMDQLYTCKKHLSNSKVQLNNSMDQLYTSKGQTNGSKDELNSCKKHLNRSKDQLIMRMNQLNTSMKALNTSKLDMNTKNTNVDTSKDQINNSRDQLNVSMDQKDSSQSRVNSSKVQYSGLSQNCDDMCGHGRLQLECVAAMHRVLLETSLKVILVELEELGPSDLQLLPESVRHIRQSQGAVCWWRTRGQTGSPWRTGCSRRTGDTEAELSSCVDPDCRFWKEVRYRMPARPERSRTGREPEGTALLRIRKDKKTDEKMERLDALTV